MRIGIVHSFYASSNPSGENATVLEQVRSLAEAGHDVLVVARHTDDESRRALYPLQSAVRVASGRGASPVAELHAFRPDLVHVHNLFPNFGTRWLKTWSGPLVTTLHNYRYACVNALLLRDNAWCTECPDGDRLAGVRHACYRGSAVASLPLAIANRHGIAAHPVVARADRVIVLSPVARDLFLRFGIPSDRMRLVPNFTTDIHGSTTLPPPLPRYLAVGRLSAEKGFAELVEQWPPGRRLDIIGGASEDATVRLPAHPDVTLLGAIDNARWRARLWEYSAMIVPSVGPEGAVPLVAVEAWEGSVPVIARAGSGLAAYIESTGAGRIYSSAASLASALEDVGRGGQALRNTARSAFEAEFSEAQWRSTIEGAYSELLHAD